MFCRNRERIFVGVARFIASCERNRRGLQVSTDWSNDVWYLWLAARPEHVTLSRSDYVSPRDFAAILRFVRGGGRPEDYRITMAGTAYYMLFRPTRGSQAGTSEEERWPLCIDNALFAEMDETGDSGDGGSGDEADSLLHLSIDPRVQWPDHGPMPGSSPL